MLNHSFSIGGGELAASRAELVAGMQLLRAVNMQSVRLQLAMLRRERRPAMESLDDLTAMDRELEQFIEGIGPAGLSAPELQGIAELVAIQKRALAEEKIALMAGVSGPKLASDPVAADLVDPVDPVLDTSGAFAGVLEPAEPGYRAMGGWARVVTALTLAAMAGAAAAGWHFWDRIAPVLGL